MNDRKTALVVCPGRGTYNAAELGYLGNHHSDKQAQLAEFDNFRTKFGQTTISELDGRDSFSMSEHMRGDNASPLIYTSSYFDFLAINQGEYDIVAITGNSMGWYTSLACAGVLSALDGLKTINTTGKLMHDSMIGGQLLYPVSDAIWQLDVGLRSELMGLVAGLHGERDQQIYLSIDLGGMLVFAGNDAGLKALEAKLPTHADSRFPMRLGGHSAFHTELQKPVAEKIQKELPASMFNSPTIPLIDGRGAIWTPHASDPRALWDYTLSHQIVETYDFRKAIQVGVREFAPSHVIVLGPGTTMGGSIAQSLISIEWECLTNKDDFTKRQMDDPYLLSMGLDTQRKLVG